MVRLFLSVVGLLGLMAPALAQRTQVIATHGAWSAYGGTSQDGRVTCGMSIVGAEDRALHIKWFRGSPGIILQAFKGSWRIPEGTSFPLEMRVDELAWWAAPAAVGSRDMVQWRVAPPDFEVFLEQFRRGNRLVIRFPSGNEAPWSVSLTGSSAIYNVFGRCVIALSEQPTQPHRSPSAPPNEAPSQPFGARPEPRVQPSSPPPPITPLPST